MVAGNVALDVCRSGCGGVWFDNFELRRIDGTGAAALSTLWRDPAMHVDAAKKRACPKCEEQPLLRRFFSARKAVEIDECPNCAGVWLDGGEFEGLQRELHPAASKEKSVLHSAMAAAISVVRSQGQDRR
jgi:Zn-finger nucleic acid-binding protein